MIEGRKIEECNFQSTKIDASEYNYHVSSCNFDSVNIQ